MSSGRELVRNGLPVAEKHTNSIACGDDASSSLSSSAAPAAAQLSSPSSSVAVWDKVKHVVCAVASAIGADEALVQALPRWFDEAAAAGAADAQETLRVLFEEKITLDSAVFRVFQAIHQSILFPAIFFLKTTVFCDVGPLKDVRRADGWFVDVQVQSVQCIDHSAGGSEVAASRLTVTHHRSEQSVEAPDDANHFEIGWELRMSFDAPRVSELKAAMLRLATVSFHEHVGVARRAQIMSKLHAENLML